MNPAKITSVQERALGRVNSKQVLTKGGLHGVSYLFWWWANLDEGFPSWKPTSGMSGEG